MERILYKILYQDFDLSKQYSKYELSKQFEKIHNKFVKLHNPDKYFNISSNITVKRKDQLILNLQYNKLYYGYYVYEQDDYLRYIEEFFSNFLSYELTTGRCSPDFPKNIKELFEILNKINL